MSRYNIYKDHITLTDFEITRVDSLLGQAFSCNNTGHEDLYHTQLVASAILIKSRNETNFSRHCTCLGGIAYHHY